MIGFQVLYLNDQWIVGVYKNGIFQELLGFYTAQAMSMFMTDYVLSNDGGSNE